MHIERRYNELEEIEELHIYEINKVTLFKKVPAVKENITPRYNNIMKHVSSDINILSPIHDGDDYILIRIGWSLLQRGNGKSEDLVGRELSKASEFYYDLLKDDLKEVYQTKEMKTLRLIYYVNEYYTICDMKIIEEEGIIFVLSDYIGTDFKPSESIHDNIDDETKFIEQFAKTGSYYKTKGKYIWTDGIYNILNRSKEKKDPYYNIILDLVIPEDKSLVDELIHSIGPKTNSYENIIRIKTHDGQIKYLDIYIHSKFDENGDEISTYGLIKETNFESQIQRKKPVDLMLSGFSQNSKLSLLIEPLSHKYEFSDGYYDILEIPKDEYVHDMHLLDYIEEESIKKDILKLLQGEITELNKLLTYNVKGDKNNQKILALLIERFNYGSKVHSIGFLTDISYAKQKQDELIQLNANKNILIKEVHHRVKNNLQVLNSFLNLERKAYGDQPYLILDNMQARLSSLALLHEKTYNTNDFVNINLKDYIAGQDDNISNLFSTKNIKFSSRIDENIHLSIEVITPLLLIIDELTMNAIKHAFPDNEMENKIISKEIEFIANNVCELILKDNGIGLESHEVLTNHNLGWEIVKSLTKQMNGKIEILDTEIGTGFRLIFPTSLDYTIDEAL